MGQPDSHSEPAIDLRKAKSEEALRSLGSNPAVGLTEAEAESRLRKHGRNEVQERMPNPLIKLAKRFWGVTPWMLETIIILSWALQKYSDVYVVSGLLVLNAAIGFYEEKKGSDAVDELRKELQVNARVIRDGRWRTIPARSLVPGDIVRIRSGDFVPADVKLLSGELAVDQSMLTGESMQVQRSADDLLYSGSIARRGEATGVVALTGVKTYFGRTTELVQIASPKSHVDEIVSRISGWLLAIVAVPLAVALIVSIAERMDLLELLPLVLVLLLGAVPVALPAMFTLSTAVGSMELVRKGVLVTRLDAVEDAASMDILCADKTGTLTTNALTVADVIPWRGSKQDDILLYGALASEEANRDPIDLAFIVAARRKNLPVSSFEQTGFVPFDPSTKKTTATVRRDGDQFQVIKGAVEPIIAECGLEKADADQVRTWMSEHARRGRRILAVAADGKQAPPRFVGLATLYDAPRPDSAGLLGELRELGISVKMLTGDALPIAAETAKDVGLGENIMRAVDLRQAMERDTVGAAGMIEDSDGFAEILPEDKYGIVKALQDRDHIVGMTGDGVNDAAALKQAEVAVAVSNATDVAKGVASVVLTSEGLSSIVDLVRNGRVTFERISTWVLNKISWTILQTLYVILTFLTTGRYLVSASAIMLLMFMSDFVKLSLATDNVKWSKKPDIWDVTRLARVAAILGLLMAVEAIGLLYVGHQYFSLTMDDPPVITFSFETLLFFSVSSIFVARERGNFWSSMPSRTLLAAMGFDVLTGIVVATFGILGFEPLPFEMSAFILAYSLGFSLVINGLVKSLLTKSSTQTTRDDNARNVVSGSESHT